MAIAALTLFAASSCSKEQAVATAEGEETLVSFTIASPVISTKAIADGNTVDKVDVNVYKADGTLISDETISKTVDMAGGKATYTARLVTGQTYQFVFWAYNEEGNHYNLNAEAKTVTVNYNGAANDETRDAFYKYIDVKKITGPIKETIVLNRPFAQINFGVNEADIAAAAAAGIEVKKSSITLADVPNVLNLVNGTASGESEVVYTVAACPEEKLLVKDTQYGYVAMGYVLAGKDEKITTNVALSIMDADGNQICEPKVVPAVPLQGNWRTNILGNLFTSDVEYNIVVDPAFADENNIDLENISTVSALKALFINGGSAKLVEDIDIDAAVNVPAGKNVNLDLNGKKINNTGANSALIVDGTLTISGEGTVYGGQGGNNKAIMVNPTGKLTINGGSYSVGPDAEGTGNSCIECWGGEIVINDGTFSSEAAWNGWYYVLNQKNNAPGTIKVYGGTFINYDPSRGDDNLGGNFVADGFVSSKISDDPVTYKVATAPTVVVKTAEELKTYLTTLTSAGAGDNIVEIHDDIVLADGETWTSPSVDGYHGAGVVTILGNGHKISGLNNPLFAGGFAGKGGIAVKDLTLENVNINDSANSQGIGAFVGSADSMPEITLINCHLVNSTIVSTGGARVGGLIGWTSGYNKENDGPVDMYVKVENCSVENTKITAKGSVGAIIGHAGANAATFQTIFGCTVKDCKLHSTDEGGWRVGLVVGTANVGQLTINNTILDGTNECTQVGKTAPEHSQLYGRTALGTTGKLTIDGTAITE